MPSKSKVPSDPVLEEICNRRGSADKAFYQARDNYLADPCPTTQIILEQAFQEKDRAFDAYLEYTDSTDDPFARALKRHDRALCDAYIAEGMVAVDPSKENQRRLKNAYRRQRAASKAWDNRSG